MTTNWKLKDGTDLDDYLHHGGEYSEGNAGLTADLTINNNQTKDIIVPFFTVNSQGHITSFGQKTITISTGRYGNSCVNCSDCNDYDYCSDYCGDCD